MRKLHIITAQPNDLYFCWQLRVQLTNLRKYDLSSRARVLIWYHTDRLGGNDFQQQWERLFKDFQEVKFFRYEDPTGELHNVIGKFNYIPLLRPWLLGKHFADYPDLSGDAVLYMDSDVVFTKKPDFSRLLEDNICYLSNTRSYIAASYFDSKVKDVLPERLEAYKSIDILDEALQEFQLNRQIAIDNEEGSGGAQYLLKNIDASFWEEVFMGCIKVRVNLGSVNRRFFENEDKGFQSWCADMWSILWNLWRRGYKTACPWEMDFCWATDPIGKWDMVQIYHDAGAHTREIEPGHQLFLKRDLPYVNNQRTPFDDDLSYVSGKYCSKNYVREIGEARMSQYPVISGPIEKIVL